MFLPGILPSQTVADSCLIFCHPKMWFVPTLNCGIFTPQTVVCSCLVFCHPKLWSVPFWYVSTQNCGMFPPQAVVCSSQTVVCSQAVIYFAISCIWYFVTQLVVCSYFRYLVCSHAKLGYVPTPHCGNSMFPAQTGMFTP